MTYFITDQKRLSSQEIAHPEQLKYHRNPHNYEVRVNKRACHAESTIIKTEAAVF